MMENTTKIYSIDGIYGRVSDIIKIPKQNNEISYNILEVNSKADKVLRNEEFIDGLPNGITKDDYFRIALLDVLKGIRDSLRADSYVNIKDTVNMSIDKDTMDRFNEIIKENLSKI